MSTPILLQKNTVTNSTINAETVHIGDKIYYSIHQEELANTILFLKITKNKENQYIAQLQINGKDQQQAISQQVIVEVDDTFFKALKGFENYKRRGGKTMLGYRHQEETFFNRDTKQRNQDYQQEAALGLALYKKWLPDNTPIRELFEQFLNLLRKQKIHNLTLVISSLEANILNIPFELMRQSIDQPPLSLLYDNLLIGHSQTEHLGDFERTPKSEVALPLRLLVLTALPWNTDGQFIDLEKEQEHIFAAIDQANKQIIKALGDLPSNRRIVVEFLEVGSLAEMERALTAGKHHILHISGHGFFFDKEGKGFLNLENEEGGLAQIAGDTLAEVLQAFKQHLKLVVVSACETARAETTGIAGALIKIGVPAIIAMRYPILDRTATLFTATFYQHLCKGVTLSESMFFARKAIWDLEAKERAQQPLNASLQNNKEGEWFTPFLYLNQYIGRLINPNKPLEEVAYFFQQHRSAFFFKGIKNEKLERSPAKLVAKGFVGRRRQLAKLTKLFRDGQRIVCLHGIGGIGKTSLAARFLDNYQNKGFEILPFVGEVTEHQILIKIAESAPKSQQADLISIVNDTELSSSEKLNFLVDGHLSEGAIALFFDNFEDNQGGTGNELSPVQLKSESLAQFLLVFCQKIMDLSADKTVFIVFTTRYKITATFAEHIYFIDVAKMDFPATYKLIMRSKGLVHLPLVNRQQVHNQLGGHPRAIQLLDSYFRNSLRVDWEVIEAKFATVENHLARHDLLLDWLWEQLTEEERYVLSVASIFRHLTIKEGLAQVVEQSETLLEDILQRLQIFSFIYLQDNSFYTHRLTAQFALSKFLLNKETQKEIQKRIALFFLACFKEEEAYKTTDAIECRFHFKEAGCFDDFAKITFDLDTEYTNKGFYRLSEKLLVEVLQTAVHPKTRVDTLINYGVKKIQLGKTTEAFSIFNQANILAQKRNYSSGESSALHQIAMINQTRGDLQLALEQYQKSYTISKKHNQNDQIANTMLQIGSVYDDLGDYDKAFNWYNKSLKLFQKLKYLAGQADALHQLSGISLLKGVYKEAEEYLMKSLVIERKLNNDAGIASTYHQIGLLFFELNELNRAFQLFNQAVAFFEKAGDKEGQSSSYHQIGMVYHEVDNFQEALKYYDHSIELSKEIGHIRGMAQSICQKGMLYQDKGNLEKALVEFQLSLDLSRQSKDDITLGANLHQIGWIHHKNNRIIEALAAWVKSYKVFTDLGLPQREVVLESINEIKPLLKEEEFLQLLKKQNVKELK